jgi:hypothetical protein
VSLRTIAAFATPAMGGSVSEIVLTVVDNESRSEISLKLSASLRYYCDCDGELTST